MPGPYRLISTDDPARTLGEAVDAGDVRYYRTLIEAANVFAKSEAPFKTVLFDDGHLARELNRDEERSSNTSAQSSGSRSERCRADADPAMRRARLS